MLEPAEFARWFRLAAPYQQYLADIPARERPSWDASAARAALTPEQAALVRSWPRRMNVLVISGSWCGDCVAQVPMLGTIAATHPADPTNPVGPGIDLRLLERNAHMELADRLRICGGHRVPTVVFLNEDFDFVSVFGDRTLARYRAIAAQKLGAACPLPGALPELNEYAATLRDWLNEFERVALLLALSPKLSARHAESR